MSIIFDFIPMIRLILQIQEALSVDNSSLQSLQLYLITTININMVTAKLTAVTVGSYAQRKRSFLYSATLEYLLLNSVNGCRTKITLEGCKHREILVFRP
jgi:hypothetical protein